MLYRSEPLKSGRQMLSNFLVFFFILTIVVAGAFSEFFQTPLQADTDLEPWNQLFTSRQLADVRELELTNKLGTFRFEKREWPAEKGWVMIHPRRLNADDNIISKIFEGILQINVLKIYPKDPINLSHYSLDNPATILKMGYPDNPSLLLKTGLVNPIDNSTYMTLSGKEPLFHIEKLNFPVESLKLADFIDSSIFTLPLAEVGLIQIHRGTRLKLSAQRRDGKWFGRRNQVFDENKMQAFFDKMLSLKSVLILDETTPQLKKRIDRYSDRPLYTVTIQDRQSRIRTYKVSHPLGKLSDVKIEKGQNCLVTSSDGSHPQLMDKEHLDAFNVKESTLQ